jgi:predicted Zn-dependent protease
MRRALLAAAAALIPAWGCAADTVPMPEGEYARIIATYSARGALDDPAMLARIRPITARLMRVIAAERPETAAWPWEVHVTSDPSVTAFCMAGGKVLVGAPFVRRLELGDPEVAMLIAHEMAHALADHRRARAPATSTDVDPAGETRANQLAVAQEDEADRIGMRLAYRAGWRLADLIGFFDKLAASQAAGTFSTSHAAPAMRAATAREMAKGIAAERPAK